MLGIRSIRSCSEGIVSHYARFIYAMNMQFIVDLLRKFWAFSTALDMVTHMATAYFNVRIHVCHKSTVHDFHLLSIPVNDRNTGKIIFNMSTKAKEDLYSDWRKNIT